MHLRGTDPFVEQVRAATEIVGLVSSYLELKRAGRRWKGLCPFHTEKTPSFFVHEENQTFYCFGCHQGGDVFQFVMIQERLTFPEALRMLAEKAGIPMPRQRAQDSSGDRIGEALEVASAFYRNTLRSPAGSVARAYLTKRGISDAEIDRFGLGLAPAAWDGFLMHARRLLPERALIQAGLVIEGDRGLYDRFRDRVMIPIRTAGGRVVAFGGRLLGPGEPKYMNSPESLIYKKGTMLFGLPEAREAIRAAGNLIVVEGYFDVISLSAAGIGETVGTCGTALTAEQASLLRRYGERWTLLFDGDDPGRAAVIRAMDAVVPVHPAVRIALCPDGSDPDSWVRREGPAALRQAVERGSTPLQYLEDWTRGQGMGLEEVLPRVTDLLRKVSDPLIRDRWVQEAAGRFRIAEARLWEAIGKAPGGSESGKRGVPPRSNLTAREREIVAAAVRRPEIAAALLDAGEDGSVIGPRCREILEWISGRFGEGIVEPAPLLSLAADEPAILGDLAFLHGETGDIEPAPEHPEEVLRRLRGWALRHRMQDLTDRIRRIEEQGGDVSSLLQEKQDLAEVLKRLAAEDRSDMGNF